MYHNPLNFEITPTERNPSEEVPTEGNLSEEVPIEGIIVMEDNKELENKFPYCYALIFIGVVVLSGMIVLIIAITQNLIS
jgi:hypothetical protein